MVSPLFIVTRPAQQAQSLLLSLNHAGYASLAFPMFVIEPCECQINWDTHYDYAFVLSQNALTHCPVQFWTHIPSVSQWLAVGSETARHLQLFLPNVSVYSPGKQEMGVDALMVYVEKLSLPSPRSALCLRGEPTRPEFQLWLSQYFDSMDSIVSYQRVAVPGLVGQLVECHQRYFDHEWVWIITSSETARFVLELFSQSPLPFAKIKMTFLCTHPRIDKIMRSCVYGQSQLVESDEESIMLIIRSQWVPQL